MGQATGQEQLEASFLLAQPFPYLVFVCLYCLWLSWGLLMLNIAGTHCQLFYLVHHYQPQYLKIEFEIHTLYDILVRFSKDQIHELIYFLITYLERLVAFVGTTHYCQALILLLMISQKLLKKSAMVYQNVDCFLGKDHLFRSQQGQKPQRCLYSLTQWQTKSLYLWLEVALRLSMEDIK